MMSLRLVSLLSASLLFTPVVTAEANVVIDVFSDVKDMMNKMCLAESGQDCGELDLVGTRCAGYACVIPRLQCPSTVTGSVPILGSSSL